MQEVQECVGAVSLSDLTNCYKYILGRTMNQQEVEHAQTIRSSLETMDLRSLRRSFLQSPEFHHRHVEDTFGNLVPQSKVICYETSAGFIIYLDLRQLHVTFGVLNEIYETNEIGLLRRLTAETSTFFDVGANCGYYSLSIAAQKAFRGKIVAFEPLSSLHALFARSIAANNFTSKIELRQLALADRAATMPIISAEDSVNAGATMLAFDAMPPGTRTHLVAVETLDRVAAGLRPDIIKIDIQGAEGLFLRGAEATIAASRPTLFFEVAPELLALLSKIKPHELQTWLEQRGYRLFILDEQNLRAVGLKEDLGSFVAHESLIDVLAVHKDREGDVAARIGNLPPRKTKAAT